MISLLRSGGPTHTPAQTANSKDQIGFSPENFADLLHDLPSLRLNFSNNIKKCETALEMYLYRLRNGAYYKNVANQFNLSEKTAKKYIDAARAALTSDFVSKNLGFQNLSRQFLIENSSEMASELFCDGNNDRAIIVADGTYIFNNKSKNYDLQRRTYSEQKKRNLTKPMVFVTTNGKFIDVLGPYEASNNDASIMASILEAGVMNLEKGDIFLLDRGFRDCLPLLEERGFEAKMPEFILKTDKTHQLTTEKANRSRLVTACRYVVETRNGHMKIIWKLFNKIWCTYDMPDLMKDYRIGAALINVYNNTIESNKCDAQEIARSMRNREGRKNKFADVMKGRFQREVKNFAHVDVSNFQFPNLGIENLKKISLGNYQINQVSPYCAEHIQKNGQFDVYVCPEPIVRKYLSEFISSCNLHVPILVLSHIYSRFRKKIKYGVYVLADTSINGPEGIAEYYCECRHGLREVGCCSHIMAVIGYLSYYRHHPNEIRLVAGFMNDFFCM